MELSRSMVSPKWTAWQLQQFAQSCRGYAVVELSTDRQIGPQHTLVLTEPACQANGSLQSVALHMRVDDGEILGVPSCEAGTSKANHNFYNAVIVGHGSPLYCCNCTNCEEASGMAFMRVSIAPLAPDPCPAKRPSE